MKIEIARERLEKVRRIVVHTDADGVASAMILKASALSGPVEYVQYDTPAHVNMKAEPGMIFCDFSPHHSRVDEFLEAGAIVLDHHKTTRSVVQRFIDRGLGAFGDEETEPGVCGATLALRHVWNVYPFETAYRRRCDAIVEDLAQLAGIRDTWQKQDPRWIEACEQAAAMNFWDWDKLVGSPPEDWAGLLKPIGKQAYQSHLRKVRKCVDSAYHFTTPAGLKAVVFQGYFAASDAAEMVDQDTDIICGFSLFFEGGKPYILCGLRSRSNFDVGAFAKAVSEGGGGHAKSAGFRRVLDLTDPNPFCFFRDIVIRYEAQHCTCGEDNNDGGPSLPHKSWCSQAGK